MSQQTLIAPSLLSADFGRLTDEVRAIERAGADLAHLDVMDGRFVPNITFGPAVVAAMKRSTALPLDVHLMIVEPERHIDAFVAAGADRVSVHAETCPHLHRTLQQIRRAGAMPAVALNPSTPLCMVEEVLGEVGMVLVMSVNPGFGGQAFIESALDKIRRLRAMADARGLSIDIEVDGGVSDKNASLLLSAGANVLVAGSYVFGQSDYAAAIASLRA
ncbi:MAG: ribulose-phosphate 3-epimerase [Myxococcaceae bacterium]|nr:ribulose-phosphate 3-epimerase [Myxococcaceae bacterium]